jgi:hypothetical protein
MVERDFAPHGRMTVQLKDMRNALATAEEIGFDAPITSCLKPLRRRRRARPGGWTTAACSWNWPVATQCNKQSALSFTPPKNSA